MDWTTDKAIASIQVGRNQPKHGIEGGFWQLDRKYGVKAYPHKGTAEVCYARQKWAAMHDLGAQVTSGLFGFFYEQKYWTGFLTGVLSVARKDGRWESEAVYDWYLSPDHPLRLGLYALGFSKPLHGVDKWHDYLDLHGNNVGYNAAGVLQCLDFGWGSAKAYCFSSTDIYRILRRNKIDRKEFIS